MKYGVFGKHCVYYQVPSVIEAATLSPCTFWDQVACQMAVPDFDDDAEVQQRGQVQPDDGNVVHHLRPYVEPEEQEDVPECSVFDDELKDVT